MQLRVSQAGFDRDIETSFCPGGSRGSIDACPKKYPSGLRERAVRLVFESVARSPRLSSLGLDERARDRLRRKGFGELPLSQAAAVARGLGGSLEWLAGADVEPGRHRIRTWASPPTRCARRPSRPA